jgi:hypothetical protein
VVDDEFDSGSARKNFDNDRQEIGIGEQANGLGFVEGMFETSLA